MDNRFLEVINKLLSATKSGRLKWQSTSRDTVFRIGLGNGILRVERNHHGFDSDSEYFTCRLYNSKGTEVESIDSYTTEDVDRAGTIRDLFICARRSALDIDKLLEDVEKDIDNGQYTNVEESSPDPDSDIPF